MRIIADFLVESDLCLQEKQESLELESRKHQFKLIISNANEEDKDIECSLSMQLIFDSASLESAKEEVREKISIALNFLSYTTNRKFKLCRIKRIVDWRPGLDLREAFVFAQVPVWDTAEAKLDKNFIETAQRLMQVESSDEQRAAMRWFRIGVEATNPDDQFIYFWFALEIVAESIKGTEKVTSKCPECNTSLFCEQCGHYPSHRKYAGDAIREVIEKVYQNNPLDTFKVLQNVRHRLMHGSTLDKLERKLNINKQEIVNILAFISWNAISLMFDEGLEDEDIPLSFGYVDNIVRGTLVATVHVTTGMRGGDPQNPRIGDLPDMHVGIKAT